MSNVAKVKTYDIANGKGIRTSIFFSGCTHVCKGCFNQELWDFNVGEHFNREFYETKIKPTINDHIVGISILGGEPFHPNNIVSTSLLVSWFKQDFPSKSIWCWTGYNFEDIDSGKMYRSKEVDINAPFAALLTLDSIDILVDGRFIEEEKDLTLKWRGSKNQRLIDVQKSLHNNKIVLFKD